MLLDKYWDTIDALYARVRKTQKESIIAAGKLIANAVDKGGCVHVHDSGHIINHELIHRGGGLVLYKRFTFALNVENAVRKRDRSGIDTSMEGLAAYALRASGALPGDVFILGSVSGRTLSVVDLAYEAKKMGMSIIALTSLSYTTQVESPHSSGKKLYELADITIDNCAPAAEAMIEIEGIEPHFAAASGLSATYILWSVSSVIIEELMKLGKTPSLLKSGNFPGGREYNMTISEPRYEKLGY